MEVEAGLTLFQRLVKKKKHPKEHLRHTTILSDGDSRTSLVLQEAKVYGYNPIGKKDCVNQVEKRMEKVLRNIIFAQKEAGTESLGGRGKLSGDLVTKLSTHYGWVKSQK